MPSIDLATLNLLPAAEFGRVVGPTFAQSRWVADAAAAGRPYATVEALWEALCAVVRDAPRSRQLALIRAEAEWMESADEGRLIAAGQATLAPAEAARFARLRADYQARFGFPLVICAPLHDQAAIISALPERLQNEAFEERVAALAEIYQIARLRLAEQVAER